MRGYETGTHSRDWRASAGKRDVGCRPATRLIAAMKPRDPGNFLHTGTCRCPGGQKARPLPAERGSLVSLARYAVNRDLERASFVKLSLAAGGRTIHSVSRESRPGSRCCPTPAATTAS